MILTSSNLKYEEMRRIVLNVVLLSEHPNNFITYNTILEIVAKKLIDQKYCVETNYYNSRYPRQSLDIADEDANLVNEIVWDLIIERVLAIGHNKTNPDWPFLRLTEYGKRLSQSGESVIIHDVDGMVGLLKESAPQCNSIIIAYYAECLGTYRINSLLASSVMLGCAAEKLMCELFDSYLFWLEKNKDSEVMKNGS